MTDEDKTTRVVKVAEAADRAWQSTGLQDQAIPLSVVAALSLCVQDDPEGPDLAGQLLALGPAEMLQTVQTIHARLLRTRPDLAVPLNPFHRPLFPEQGQVDERTRDGVHAVAQAALRAGLLGFMAEHRCDVDLLGACWSQMRTRTSRSVSGVYYTPEDVCLTMAEMTLGSDEVQPGASICDPAIGTGGLFRGAAQVIRSRGGDPADCTWFGVDIDELAIACCAVNAIHWGLGPRVVLIAGNTLTDRQDEPGLYERALAQREETLTIARCASALALVRAA